MPRFIPSDAVMPIELTLTRSDSEALALRAQSIAPPLRNGALNTCSLFWRNALDVEQRMLFALHLCEYRWQIVMRFDRKIQFATMQKACRSLFGENYRVTT